MQIWESSFQLKDLSKKFSNAKVKNYKRKAEESVCGTLGQNPAQAKYHE